MEKPLTMATKNESNAYSDWEKNLFYSAIPGLIFGFLSAFIPNSSLLQSIMIGLLTAGLGFVTQVLIDMKRFFSKEVENNPIIMALPDISKKIKDIPKLTTKNGSVDFAIDSLKKISDEGFVQLNVGIADYIKYLIILVKNTKEYIYGTNIFRPKTLVNRINSHTPGISEYLKILRESKCRQKIRINILSKTDIKEIIKDAVISLETKQADGKVELCENEFIPEIVWYLKEINGWQTGNKNHKVDVLWTTHDLAIERISLNSLPKSETSNQEIDDYAIFDKQILFLYDYNETVFTGNMVLQWDSETKEGGKVQRYLTPFLKIADHLQNQCIYKETNLFLHFSDLIDQINWGSETIDVHNIAEEVKSYFTDLRPGFIYKTLERLIKTNKLKFKDTHSDSYFKIII